MCATVAASHTAPAVNANTPAPSDKTGKALEPAPNFDKRHGELHNHDAANERRWTTYHYYEGCVQANHEIISACLHTLYLSTCLNPLLPWEENATAETPQMPVVCHNWSGAQTGVDTKIVLAAVWPESVVHLFYQPLILETWTVWNIGHILHIDMADYPRRVFICPCPYSSDFLIFAIYRNFCKFSYTSKII
jgi:hypothetical protein